LAQDESGFLTTKKRFFCYAQRWSCLKQKQKFCCSVSCSVLYFCHRFVLLGTSGSIEQNSYQNNRNAYFDSANPG